MAKRASNEPQFAKLTTQQMRDAIPKLERRIAELKRLEPEKLTKRGDPSFDAVENKANHTLAEIFGVGTVQYNNYHVMLDTAGISFGGGTPMQEVIEGYKEGIASAIANFETAVSYFKEELGERAGPEEQPLEAAGIDSANNIFVVHGHDDAARLEVARFLERLGLVPVVLHEQANEGQTIIEKFEKHARAAKFAVVLLTPDDVGYPAGKTQEAKPRARQNVILEFGFFVSKLGRDRVVALVKGDVEIPSDLHGLLYEKMDRAGAWRFRVANEMRATGISVDMNRI